jgi:hypothetical protein
LSRSQLDYEGWWNSPSVAPITWHVPLTIGQSRFLERCKDLNALIIEGLNERNLRTLLLRIGVNSEYIRNFRGLKLLDTLLQFAIIIHQTGLDFVSDSEELIRRWLDKCVGLEEGQYLETPIGILFILYDLRVSASHRQTNIDAALERLGTDPVSIGNTWGGVLDQLYDSIGLGLEKTAQILRISE